MALILCTVARLLICYNGAIFGNAGAYSCEMNWNGYHRIRPNSGWLSFRVKNNLLQWAPGPQICGPLKLIHNPSTRNSCFCFFCSFPPRVTKSPLTPFHFLHRRTHLLSLCFYILLSPPYIPLFFSLPLIIFKFCLRLLLYIFSFYYSPVSSSISPLILSPSCYPAVTLSL